MNDDIIVLIVILIVIILTVVIINRNNNQKIVKAEEEEKKNKDFNNSLQSEIEKLENIFAEEFIFSKCSKCNDITFCLRRFNSSYTSIEAKCSTCGKLVWFKSESDHISNLKEISTKIVELYSTNYDVLSDISDLEIYFKYNAIITKNEDTKRRSIPTKTKQDVWQRDKGKCAECGSKEKLEYDHIIPVSKGGQIQQEIFSCFVKTVTEKNQLRLNN